MFEKVIEKACVKTTEEFVSQHLEEAFGDIIKNDEQYSSYSRSGQTAKEKIRAIVRLELDNIIREECQKLLKLKFEEDEVALNKIAKEVLIEAVKAKGKLTWSY